MRLVKGGLAEKAGFKCELNIHTATRNDHINIRTGYPCPIEEKRRSLKNLLDDARYSTNGNVY